MFNWLKKKETIVFTDNSAAFEYACKNLPNKVLLEAILPALVEEVGPINAQGERTFRLRIADKNGGWELWAATLKGAPAFPAAGDLVGFRIVRIATDLPEGMNIIGFVAVKLAPVLVTGKGWRTEQSFMPNNIKPTIRF